MFNPEIFNKSKYCSENKIPIIKTIATTNKTFHPSIFLNYMLSLILIATSITNAPINIEIKALTPINKAPTIANPNPVAVIPAVILAGNQANKVPIGVVPKNNTKKDDTKVNAAQTPAIAAKSL